MATFLTTIEKLAKEPKNKCLRVLVKSLLQELEEEKERESGDRYLYLQGAYDTLLVINKTLEGLSDD